MRKSLSEFHLRLTSFYNIANELQLNSIIDFKHYIKVLITKDNIELANDIYINKILTILGLSEQKDTTLVTKTAKTLLSMSNMSPSNTIQMLSTQLNPVTRLTQQFNPVTRIKQQLNPIQTITQHLKQDNKTNSSGSSLRSNITKTKISSVILGGFPFNIAYAS